jgi:hypothetical protein
LSLICYVNLFSWQVLLLLSFPFCRLFHSWVVILLQFFFWQVYCCQWLTAILEEYHFSCLVRMQRKPCFVVIIPAVSTPMKTSLKSKLAKTKADVNISEAFTSNWLQSEKKKFTKKNSRDLDQKNKYTKQSQS